MALVAFSGYDAQSTLECVIATGTVTFDTTVRRNGQGASLRLDGADSLAATRTLRHRRITQLSLNTNLACLTIYIYVTTSVSHDCVFIRAWSTNAQAGVMLRTDDRLAVYGWTGIVATTTDPISKNAWHRIDLSANRSTGAYELKVDKVQVLTGTGNLGTSGNYLELDTGADFLGSTPTSFKYYLDDWFYDDAAFTAADRIDLLLPDGNGNYTAWTNDFAAVDEAPPYSSSDFIEVTSNSGDETFTLSSMTAGLTPLSVTSVYVGNRSSGTGTCNITPRMRSNGVDSNGTATSMGSTHTLRGLILNTDPSGGGAWTETRINALEAGVSFSGSGSKTCRVYWVAAYVAVNSTQTLSPSGIATAEELGTPSLIQNQTLSPSGIASDEGLGAASIFQTQTISAPSITSDEQFGSVVLSAIYSILAAAIASAEQFGDASVSVGAVALLPAGILSGEQLGSPTMTPGAVSFQPASIPSDEQFGGPYVSPGAVNVAPSPIASSEQFGDTSVLPSAVSLLPLSIPSGEAMGDPAVSAGAAGQQVEPASITSLETVPAPFLYGPISLNVAASTNGGVASASSTNSVYSPTLVPSHANDGSRDNKPPSYGYYKWWEDDTYNTFPDCLQIDFNDHYWISEIDIIGLHDDFDNSHDPALSDTFTLYGLTDFEIQYWNGVSWEVIPGGSITGNNKVWRQFKFPAIWTNKIRAVVTATGDGRTRIIELEAWTRIFGPAHSIGFPSIATTENFGDATLQAGAVSVLPPAVPSAEAFGDINVSGGESINVALAANGGTASASSVFSGAYPIAAINNGDRTGAAWGSGGGWNDATVDTFPDWAQIDFARVYQINRIDVITLRDVFSGGGEPTLSETFSLYGIVDFDVEYWDGDSWELVLDGAVTGNNKVWRQFTFDSITTDKIRVVVNSSPDPAGFKYSRIVEVEAWTAGGAQQTVEPSGIASSEASGSPMVQPSAFNLLPSGIASGELMGDHSLLPGAVTILAQAINSLESFGNASILPGAVSILAQAISSLEAFGSAQITAGAVILVVPSIPSGEVLGDPALSAGALLLLLSSVPSSEAFGSPAITTGAVALLLSGIASGEMFGSPAISAGTIIIIPSSIPSEEGFGLATLLPGAVTIFVTSIGSGEVFGTPFITVGAVVVLPSSIPSAETFGDPTVTPGMVVMLPAGISSGETFSAPSVSTRFQIDAVSVPSAEAFGSTEIEPGSITIQAESIDSAEAFGVPFVNAIQMLFIESIESGESFGVAVIETVGFPGALIFIGDQLVYAIAAGTLILTDLSTGTFSPVRIISGTRLQKGQQ
jgi:hypothetical protein